MAQQYVVFFLPGSHLSCCLSLCDDVHLHAKHTVTVCLIVCSIATAHNNLTRSIQSSSGDKYAQLRDVTAAGVEGGVHPVSARIMKHSRNVFHLLGAHGVHAEHLVRDDIAGTAPHPRTIPAATCGTAVVDNCTFLQHRLVPLPHLLQSTTKFVTSLPRARILDYTMMHARTNME